MRNPRSTVLRIGLGVVFLLYKTPFRGLLARLYLLILHRGRRTGVTYETLVTILHRDEESGEIFVTSSMQGARADWYRNLKVSPPVAIEIGSSRLQVRHRFLHEQERIALYRKVCAERPIRARIGLFVTGHRWPRTQQDYVRLARDMPAIAFTRVCFGSRWSTGNLEILKLAIDLNREPFRRMAVCPEERSGYVAVEVTS